MRRPVPENFNELLVLARRLGWAVTPCRDGWRLVHPDGGTATIHGQARGHRPSNWRTWRNMTADLYRTERGR